MVHSVAIRLSKPGLYATVVQLAERQISNLNVAGSYPVSRSIENQLFQLDRGLAVHWQTTGITPVNDAEPNRKGNKVQAE